MELICSESSPPMVDIFCPIDYGITFSVGDQNILNDSRILRQLLQTEEQYVANGVLESYKCIQSEVEPYMRKIVANWMLEVCEEMNCEEVVFTVAMNFLDRFLVNTDIRKNQLQLVGVVCLLIASKLRQTQNLEPNILSFFTDYSVTVQEIIAWELLVLKRLKWDVSSVVATDYLDYLLARLSPNIASMKSTIIPSISVESIVRRHSSTFISLCTTGLTSDVDSSRNSSSLLNFLSIFASASNQRCARELQFSCCLPSLIAAASIATAVKGLLLRHNSDTHHKSYQTLVTNLAKLVASEPNCINNCVEQIESLISSSTTLTHKLIGFGTSDNKQAHCAAFSQITTCTNIAIEIVERSSL